MSFYVNIEPRRAQVLAAGEACKAIHSDLPQAVKATLDSRVAGEGGRLNLCVRSTLPQEEEDDEEEQEHEQKTKKNRNTTTTKKKKKKKKFSSVQFSSVQFNMVSMRS